MLIKICGLTCPEDAEYCHQVGVDLTGFIFAKNSPRAITPEAVAAIPKNSSRRVGVFTDASLNEALQTAQIAHLDMIQLHGGQDEAYCRALASRMGAKNIIKVFWPEQLWERHPHKIGSSPAYLTTEDLGATLETFMLRFAPYCGFFLLDAGTRGGGSGRPLDWSFLNNLQAPHPWLLAGGLSPDNMRQACMACKPDGLDLNSGVETAPGLKDHIKIQMAMHVLAQCNTQQI